MEKCVSSILFIYRTSVTRKPAPAGIIIVVVLVVEVVVIIIVIIIITTTSVQCVHIGTVVSYVYMYTSTTHYHCPWRYRFIYEGETWSTWYIDCALFKLLELSARVRLRILSATKVGKTVKFTKKK